MVWSTAEDFISYLIVLIRSGGRPEVSHPSHVSCLFIYSLHVHLIHVRSERFDRLEGQYSLSMKLVAQCLSSSELHDCLCLERLKSWFLLWRRRLRYALVKNLWESVKDLRQGLWMSSFHAQTVLVLASATNTPTENISALKLMTDRKFEGSFNLDLSGLFFTVMFFFLVLWEWHY